MFYNQGKPTQLHLGFYSLIQLCKHELSCPWSVNTSQSPSVTGQMSQSLVTGIQRSGINAPPYILQSKPRDQTPVISIVPHCVDDRVSPWPTLKRRAICRVTDGPGSVFQVTTFRWRFNLIWSRGEKRRKGPCKHRERSELWSHHTPQASPQFVYYVL